MAILPLPNFLFLAFGYYNPTTGSNHLATYIYGTSAVSYHFTRPATP